MKRGRDGFLRRAPPPCVSGAPDGTAMNHGCAPPHEFLVHPKGGSVYNGQTAVDNSWQTSAQHPTSPRRGMPRSKVRGSAWDTVRAKQATIRATVGSASSTVGKKGAWLKTLARPSDRENPKKPAPGRLRPAARSGRRGTRPARATSHGAMCFSTQTWCSVVAKSTASARVTTWKAAMQTVFLSWRMALSSHSLHAEVAKSGPGKGESAEPATRLQTELEENQRRALPRREQATRP